MKYIKTFEDKTEDGDTFTKLQFCRKCQEQTKHLDDKCLKCKKDRESEKLFNVFDKKPLKI